MTKAVRRTGASAAASNRKAGGGRQPLPRHLKRERIVRDLPEAEKHCTQCAQDLRLIGEDTSERYEYIPASLLVVEAIAIPQHLRRRLATPYHVFADAGLTDVDAEFQ